MDNAKVIWEYLINKGLPPYGAAALMGNLYAESGLRPNNLQDAYERKLGMTDEQYTDAVDYAQYRDFVTDEAGYGLAQWTYSSRKAGLLNYALTKLTSIGDLEMQLDYLWNELLAYHAVLDALRNATSIRDASDVVLTQYERPKDQSEEMRKKRASFGQKYYDQFAKGEKEMEKVFNSTDYAAWLKEQARLRRPYWYGTYWLPCTESLLQKKRGQYPKHYTDDRMPRYRQDIANKQRCADCVNGAIKGAVWSELGKREPVYASHGCPDTNADGMFEKCKGWGMDWGNMSTMPDQPGVAVRMAGHGEVVEWRGFAYGCVETK